MKTSLRNIGNSKGAVIPAPILKELGLNVGDQLTARAVNGQLIMTPVQKPKYSLKELLAKCDKTAPLPPAIAEWERIENVGSEI